MRTQYETNESVCIVDFCGYQSPGHFPRSFSCDWFPEEQLAYFTGDWGVDELPAMTSKQEPTEKQVLEWAKKHGSDC